MTKKFNFGDHNGIIFKIYVFSYYFLAQKCLHNIKIQHTRSLEKKGTSHPHLTHLRPPLLNRKGSLDNGYFDNFDNDSLNKYEKKIKTNFFIDMLFYL
jgi:hypothetical protein